VDLQPTTATADAACSTSWQQAAFEQLRVWSISTPHHTDILLSRGLQTVPTALRMLHSWTKQHCATQSCSVGPRSTAMLACPMSTHLSGFPYPDPLPHREWCQAPRKPDGDLPETASGEGTWAPYPPDALTHATDPRLVMLLLREQPPCFDDRSCALGAASGYRHTPVRSRSPPAPLEVNEATWSSGAHRIQTLP
jgi:hypothetical protein